MKIITLHIYGYGQLADVTLDNLADFQIFFGENEAGKSTIMAFIHGVLFGFPTKQQAELRYEPKHHTKYGGKIRIYHEKLGYGVIERVKGKAAGDVSVIMDNGTIGGEELLKELLANFDKNLFQAVFSFNLHGLQNIHQMKGEEIGKFLFSAGTIGTERLAKTESYLQKELESRFKPSGKKPVLNGKLQALHELDLELKKSATKNKEYTSLVGKSESLQQEIEQISGTLQDIQERKEKLNEWSRIEAIVKEEKRAKKELEVLGEVDAFPVRGIERLEKLTELIHPCNAKLKSISERIAHMKQELETINPDDSFLEAEPELLTLLEQVPIYEQLKLDKQQYETKLLEYEEELSVIKEKLHLPLHEEDIFTINTNIYMKNEVEMASQKRKKLEEVKQELENQYQEEKKSLEEIEKEILQTESRCLPKQKKTLLEQQLAAGNDKQHIKAELENTKDKIEFYQFSIERDKAVKGRQKRQYLIFESILAGIFLYGVFTEQWILLWIGLAGIVIITFLLYQSLKQFRKEKVTAQQTLDVLKEKENQLRQKLQSGGNLDLTKVEEQLQRDQERQEQLKLLAFKLKQQQAQFDKVITKFEDWEYESAENKKKLAALSKGLKIPENMAAVFLSEAFQFIEQYKSIVREKRHLLHRLEDINDRLVKIENGIKAFENRYLPEIGSSIQQSATLLRNKLKAEHEKQVKSRERQAKLVELEDEWRQNKQELEHLQAEYNKLMKSANVKTEQQFYELGEKAEKRAQLRERLDTLQAQLQFSILSEQEREVFLQNHQHDRAMVDLNSESQLLRSKLKVLQEEQATNKYQIQVLEEGGVYSDLLHQFKQKKYEFKEDVKEWAVYSLAQDILKRTIDTYKNIHLPRMLIKAQEYLVFLTNGRYQRIHLHPSGSGFLVESCDHTMFEANELSQATTEQLYVSIRLALATTLYENYQFPIIIDDSFVNFDAGRTRKVIELLKKLAGNQILFFTCHEHLLSLFKNESVLTLEKGGVQIIS